MNAIACFNVPPGTLPQAVKVYSWAFGQAEKHRDCLSVEVRKNIALGHVTRWACQQDDPTNWERLGTIVRQAGDLVTSRYCFEASLGG